MIKKSLYKKNQAVLEYIITLTAIIVAIMGLTGAFRFGLNNNLNEVRTHITEQIRSSSAPENVKNESYYSESKEYSDSNWTATTDRYGGPSLPSNLSYYFYEGEFSTAHLPKAGSILDSDTSYQAIPPIDILKELKEDDDEDIPDELGEVNTLEDLQKKTKEKDEELRDELEEELEELDEEDLKELLEESEKDD